MDAVRTLQEDTQRCFLPPFVPLSCLTVGTEGFALASSLLQFSAGLSSRAYYKMSVWCLGQPQGPSRRVPGGSPWGILRLPTADSGRGKRVGCSLVWSTGSSLPGPRSALWLPFQGWSWTIQFPMGAPFPETPYPSLALWTYKLGGRVANAIWIMLNDFYHCKHFVYFSCINIYLWKMYHCICKNFSQ